MSSASSNKRESSKRETADPDAPVASLILGASNASNPTLFLHYNVWILAFVSTFAFYLQNCLVDDMLKSYKLDETPMQAIDLISGALTIVFPLVIGRAFDVLGNKRTTVITALLASITFSLRLLGTYHWSFLYASILTGAVQGFQQLFLTWTLVYCCRADGRRLKVVSQVMAIQTLASVAAFHAQPYLLRHFGVRVVMCIATGAMALVTLVADGNLRQEKKCTPPSFAKYFSMCHATSYLAACCLIEWTLISFLLALPLATFKSAFDQVGHVNYNLSIDDKNVIISIAVQALSIAALFFLVPNSAVKTANYQVKLQLVCLLSVLVGYISLSIAHEKYLLSASLVMINVGINTLRPFILWNLLNSSDAQNEIGQMTAIFFMAHFISKSLGGHLSGILLSTFGLLSIPFIGFVFTCLAIYEHATITGYL